MRRIGRAVFGVAVLASVVSAGCSTTGDDDGEKATTSVAVTTTAEERRGSTTTTDHFEGEQATTVPRADDGGAPAPWSAVQRAAGAQHGVAQREVNMVDPDTGRQVIPDVRIEMEFDARRDVVHADIEIPDTADSEGGRIEIYYSPGSVVMKTDWTRRDCGSEWVEMSDMMATLGTDFGGDFGSMAQIPMPPFDEVLDRSPVEGARQSGATAFEVTIPAAHLVSQQQIQQYPEVAENIEGMEVPAEVRLEDDGTLVIDARAPLFDLLPFDEADAPAEMRGLEMTGLWRLEPADEPLELFVPRGGVAAEGCLGG